MLIYNSFTNYINNAPHFIIPHDIYSTFYALRIILNNDCKEYLDEDLLREIKNDYGSKLNSLDFDKMKKTIIAFLSKQNDVYKLTKTKNNEIMIHYDTPEVPEDMLRCDNCGNVWDGNAQCSCNQNPYY